MKCAQEKRKHCIGCPDLKKCKIENGEWRGYYYNLDNMKVVMPHDLDDFLKNEFRFIPDMPKKKEERVE